MVVPLADVASLVKGGLWGYALYGDAGMRSVLSLLSASCLPGGKQLYTYPTMFIVMPYLPIGQSDGSQWL